MVKNEVEAIDIAKWFIWKNHIEQLENIIDDDNYEVYEGVTHLKVQKLLYYAQGICLALYNKPLFNENIVAWQLREKSHVVGGPWEETVSSKGMDKIIDNDLIKAYFKENIISNE